MSVEGILIMIAVILFASAITIKGKFNRFGFLGELLGYDNAKGILLLLSFILFVCSLIVYLG
jgi:uncharacterized membrane protein